MNNDSQHVHLKTIRASIQLSNKVETLLGEFGIEGVTPEDFMKIPRIYINFQVLNTGEIFRKSIRSRGFLESLLVSEEKLFNARQCVNVMSLLLENLSNRVLQAKEYLADGRAMAFISLIGSPISVDKKY